MDLNLNALRRPDPGPRDGSILCLQHQHRSREVWEADRTRPVDSKKVRVRSAKKGIRALPWPSPPVLELIRRARLEGLCSLPFVSVDWGLITALLERWRPETHTFHLRPGESTITLQDVEVLLGIPVDGKPMTGNTNLKPNDLCKHLLGEQPTEESDINGMKVKASWLSDRFTGQVEEGADPEVVARQARGYLLLLMGETIFADHSGMFGHPRLPR
ncbi:serine/threonine-protein phosphatase 7 long form homolog [Rhododendron vialii]|uniref:serine/threonine-protein phosphatase 7 long form homolog n=1 Tax=Rhododendron vialii TaxID=182163 RepID=UPI00265F0EF0|nr:serine/threonine-protein phosphatase 7 long form homolog [Rhododendron vialii]